MIFKNVFSLAILTVVAYATTNRSYDGYKVYEVQQQTREQADVLRQLEQSFDDLDFLHLSKQLGSTARVLVPPALQAELEETLSKHGIQFIELIPNVQRSLDENINVGTKKSLNAEEAILSTYLRHSEIDNYLEDLARKHPSQIRVDEVGKSYEGRPIKTITINDKPNNTVIFLDAGIHAREWIAPATALYAINQLAEHSDEHQNILENVTWVILPVVNPDGYEFSHQTDRLWRKTRKPAGHYIGTDGNRNFDFHWGEVGASSSPASEIYRGDGPFSEPETQTVRNVLQRLQGSCKFYLTLHSYGNYLLYPWGWTSDLPNNWRDIDEVAQAGADAIEKATGTYYTVGSSTNVLYAAAGGSDDWALAKSNVSISITMELPGGGSIGFDPPASSIEKSVKESWVGIRAMALKVAQTS
ncbi:carboxypeptidase B-like [Toxorhynchites rutilus septentrionalis]|uniref:carboxypeptidase B-like n=1 Tax=Toxorhynchites rutilus septentrionalis TaxID=329112 RepID=UPI002479E1A1|nr:carboxypeptidase B-like [Toxorhynchites rutilus septentrionalis]